ncbi:unnamed protein product [Rhodiola kirilowii]
MLPLVKINPTSSWVHPLHFAKCITKSIDAEFNKKMDHPSNGLSVFGCLRPAFVDGESYLRRLFFEASNGYILDWNDTEMSSFNSEQEEHNCTSTIYRMLPTSFVDASSGHQDRRVVSCNGKGAQGAWPELQVSKNVLIDEDLR